VLNHDAVDLRDYAASVHTLKKDVERIGKEALIDKVAYTWFKPPDGIAFYGRQRLPTPPADGDFT